ncbi:hypothetical protein DDE82_009139 [Stemphylium lycopersici]|nr:hypothetical protein DDE82_009139 [Stemphylium lycopersici]
MPFGLTNAPATFQAVINKALHEYLGIFATAYLDDILVYSKGTLEEHVEHVKKVFLKAPVLEMYDLGRKTRVETNASDFALGAVAEQVETLQQQWQQKAANWQFEPEENGSDELLQDEREYRDMISKDRTYVPPHLRPDLIKELHESPEYGHAATEEMDTFLAKLGVKKKLSTSFHPKTDSQTERTNQTLEQYLRMYANKLQDNWVELLPTAQLAYNSTKSATTRQSPHYANYGYEPIAYQDPKDIESIAVGADDKARLLRELHEELSKNIA